MLYTIYIIYTIQSFCISNIKNCLRQRRRAEEEAAQLSDFQLSVAVSPTTPLPAQQSSPAAAIEFKLYFPSVKYFMILGFLVLDPRVLVLDSCSRFGLTDSLRLSISQGHKWALGRTCCPLWNPGSGALLRDLRKTLWFCHLTTLGDPKLKTTSPEIILVYILHFRLPFLSLKKVGISAPGLVGRKPSSHISEKGSIQLLVKNQICGEILFGEVRWEGRVPKQIWPLGREGWFQISDI